MKIKQRIFHSKREVNTKLLFIAINVITVTNHTREMRKIKMTKKVFDNKKYIIKHLQLRQKIKIIKINTKSEKENANTIEQKKKISMKKIKFNESISIF